MRTGAVVLAVVFALGTASCTARGAAQPSAVRSVGHDVAASQVRAVTPAEETLLYDAEQLLIRDCMREAGFTYYLNPREPVPGYRTFPLVVDDVAWARRHGYGSDLEARMQQAGAADPNKRYFNGLSHDQRAVAIVAANGPVATGLKARLPNGILAEHSSVGCVAESWRKLYGDQAGWYRTLRLTENLPGVRTAMVQGDKRYQRAVAAWSACMKSHSYSYPTPADARAAALDAQPRMDRHAEIALAVTEATCAHSTGLATTATSLDREYSAVVDRKFHDDVTTHRRLQVAALDRARAIVQAA